MGRWGVLLFLGDPDAAADSGDTREERTDRFLIRSAMDLVASRSRRRRSSTGDEWSEAMISALSCVAAPRGLIRPPCKQKHTQATCVYVLHSRTARDARRHTSPWSTTTIKRDKEERIQIPPAHIHPPPTPQMSSNNNHQTHTNTRNVFNKQPQDSHEHHNIYPHRHRK